MDVHESEETLQKHSAVTSRPPLFPADKNYGTIGRLRTREVSSRYRSAASSPVSPCSQYVQKRAPSSGRKRPSSPASPSRPFIPVHDASTKMQVAASQLPELLWPSTRRSLSVSFQSDTFSLALVKKERPVDRAPRPASNVAQKQAETSSVLRKPTPERKRSPLKGKDVTGQPENSMPVHVCAELVDHCQWGSRAARNICSNAFTSSLNHSNKNAKTSTLPDVGIGIPFPGRMSFSDGMSTPLQKSASGIVTLASHNNCGSMELEVDYDKLQASGLRNPFSSHSLEGMTLMTHAVRSQFFPTTKSCPPSPSASLSKQSSSSTSVLSFIADIRKGNKHANHIEDAHQLRLLYNRYLQWRYANAQADAALSTQKVTTETILCRVWRTISELVYPVTEKRIGLQQLRLKLKLFSVLNKQMAYLEEWASIGIDHINSLSQAIEDLQSSILRLPVTGGATADIETVKTAVSSAVDMMQATGSSISSVLSRMEGMNCLVSGLAEVAAQERAILDECEALLDSTAAMRVGEYSLRTQLIQRKQTLKNGQQALSNQKCMAA
ncbi:AUGMIN subunit 8-like isoform X2 [Diospyros lotus]|uniref:AUGMIN subunit 8-like isoform X2 n=1 Tax=Diospyros lotus TaxID=55363 RepID=UPI00225892C6|nr:AUGMIN subunit 8-like isoform X2 [Diospyros lotus]